MKNTSAARERELYRYYQPENDSVDAEGNKISKASSDPILTAFAQLGAHRLNAKRGLITLSTNDVEYMLAESGKALSLQRDDDENDRLWHGVGTFQCRRNNTHKTVGAELVAHFCASDDTHIVVNDLSKHETFKDKCVVVEEPYVRFLVAVPLRTPYSKAVIGNYIVADDKPRDGLNESELEFLVDMAVTVMDYLEAGLLKRKQYRSERMIKAISLFIEGKSTLRDWWLEWGHRLQQPSLQKRTRVPVPLDHLADAEFGVQEPTANLSKGLDDWPGNDHSLPQTPSVSSAPSRIDFGDGRPTLPRGESHQTSTDSTAPSTLVSKSWKDRNSSVTTVDTLVEPPPDRSDNRQSVSFDLPPPQLSDDISKELQDALLSADLKAVFSRASNLIREAIGVQGVIFFDASIGTFGASADRNIMEEKAPGQFHVDVAPTSSEDELGRKLSAPENDINGHSDSGQQTEHSTEKCCNILGFSTRSRSSLRGHQPSEEYGHLPETILRRLLKRYPHGKIFNFDADGAFSSSDTDNSTPRMDPSTGIEHHKHENKTRRRRLSKEAEAKAILNVLPGARSVFWFPLWDQNRERWFAGTLVWSTTPTRCMCPTEDLTYLAAFGNSTMAEVARISAQVLDKMKSDFISSISHELRSPLHGVLASVEFLQETSMSEVQEEMVSNIQASGKVLLDTINHVLDFSKVNRKAKNKPKLSKGLGRRRKKHSSDPPRAEDDEEEKTDILVLSEEVIEAIYAGQSVNKSGLNPAKRHSVVPKDSPLTIITHVKWYPEWTFDIDPGAWSRILMNLFSNAMKYTKTGFVKVSLEVEDEGVARSKKSRSSLLLKVKDSGRGISEEFLKHKLYKPFTQEDSLATGTGLGLSIVRHIIQDLGGQIMFTSEVGTGTEATVRIPLTASQVPIKTDGPNMVSEVRKAVKGFKFHLEGFDRYPDISETPTGILSPDVEGAMLLKESANSLMTGWFGMESSLPLASDGSGVDVIGIMESGIGDKSVQDILQAYDLKRPTKSGKSIAVVLCTGYRPGPRMNTCGSFQMYYLQQPYGPHKAAKILHTAFCQNNITVPGTETNEGEQPTQTKPVQISTQNLEVPSERQVHSPRPDTEKNQSTPTPSPIKAPDQPSENGKPSNPSTTTESKEMRVLLVEDNEINLKLLVATMRKLKITHSTAMNGLEALNTYKDCRGQFDVIFMDISMPVMSGIDSARHIRRYEKDEKLEPTKLIALTGAANPATRQEAFSSGVDLYLTKPVSMKELRGMLEEIRREGWGPAMGERKL
ncbi:hypothetical protein G7Y89_g13605 [Cudoniella acicularis]|uniref:Uncharacterized protein n=1 Tax=Cudoniella acicularis TaxID=354080 RepID=A0A8H4R985_9HELO|nr:hypothetical protein G7Y89_g13605 [Cudoniella acicularis]